MATMMEQSLAVMATLYWWTWWEAAILYNIILHKTACIILYNIILLNTACIIYDIILRNTACITYDIIQNLSYYTTWYYIKLHISYYIHWHFNGKTYYIKLHLKWENTPATKSPSSIQLIFKQSSVKKQETSHWSWRRDPHLPYSVFDRAVVFSGTVLDLLQEAGIVRPVHLKPASGGERGRQSP